MQYAALAENAPAFTTALVNMDDLAGTAENRIDAQI